MNTSNLTKYIESLQEGRNRTLDLISDLDDEQMIGPRLEIVNPLRWEIGHVAWFQEYWLLRHLLGRAPTLSAGDALYDSAKVAHETRWDLPLPSKAETITYTQRILGQVIDHYCQSGDGSNRLTDDAVYFLALALFHEDMHAEAITYTRQTLGYSAPKFSTIAQENTDEQSLTKDEMGDAFIPGATFPSGSKQAQRFVFDNEMSVHEVRVEPFSIELISELHLKSR